MDESGSDEIEDDSDAYDDDSNSSNDVPQNEHGVAENNVNSTNGFADDSFDPDATLPLSPSDKITMNGTGER